MSPDRERRSLSFSSECDDGMEESVISNLSPPRSVRSSGHNENGSMLFNSRGISNTPKSRRLFNEGSDDEEISDCTPCRRSKLKPLSLDDDLDSIVLENQVVQGRKRTSGDNKVSSFYKQDSSGSRQMDHSGSDESDVAMYASPRISPNSYITMDGRYVQSKNPFSSPMMEETPVSNQPPCLGFATSEKAAPSLPVSFYPSSESRSVLPPRHNRHLPHTALERQSCTPASDMLDSLDSTFNLNGGYPDKRFSFTGSPIIETGFEMAALETGIASSGSLRKVRKLNLNDDVVSATSQNLFNRQIDHKLLSISTGICGNSKFAERMLDEQGISPTDIISFPVETPKQNSAPPPTPVKGRPNYNLYGSIRRRNISTPGPPVLERRRFGPSKSPGAQHLLNGQSDDDTNDNDNDRLKSRFYSDFDVIGELGEGSFGKVYKVLSRLDGCMYAIKAAHRQAKGSSDRGRMLREVYALAALSDQADTANFHIVRYHQAWMEDDRLFIQTELCLGTLRDEMGREGLVFEKRRYKLLREMLLALDFIHRSNMVHLDIKPDNIFIKNDQYKLGDFGLVTKLSTSQDVEEGDSRYMSMELLSGDKSDLRKSDIFSLGATLYEICLGRNLPMNGQEWTDMRSDKLSPLSNTGEDMTNIIRQMMNPVPATRPTPLELLQHPQLLSEEQKALNAAKSKVAQATMQLAAQEHRFQMLAPTPIARRGLTRANTWNGSTLPYL